MLKMMAANTGGGVGGGGGVVSFTGVSMPRRRDSKIDPNETATTTRCPRLPGSAPLFRVARVGNGKGTVL